jgi:exopolysaccharide biosynthesis polyprenyl glycosylphosphotransferase
MTAVEHSASLAPDAVERAYLGAADVRALFTRRSLRRLGGRGWLVRRSLALADVVGLSLAFLLSLFIFGSRGAADDLSLSSEFVLFIATLPGWLVVAKLHGLYERDEQRADHSTVDDVVGVFHLVTIGAWLLFIAAWGTRLADPEIMKLVTFWLLAICFVTVGRVVARATCRRLSPYRQNTVIVGAGDIGQLVARKLLRHPEYGINLIGFVDPQPRERRPDLKRLTLLGSADALPSLVRQLDIDRVIIAFSNEPEEQTLAIVRSLRDADIQVDVVPRLFELVGPRVGVHSVEGLPLVSLPPSRPSTCSLLLKRALDAVAAATLLLCTAPAFAVIAWRIRHDSPGPIFFRQERLGRGMEPFTALKFRTMKVGTDTTVHRDYIKATMSSKAAAGENGLYKLDRGDAITQFGHWLRKTSLDELPQLINVLRGEMSLVGPRPCLGYETEHFASHHFERFIVPAGLTGLWQVTARANSTFGEALDMDVAYARGWSLGLDLRLLFRTPVQVLRQRKGTA